MKSNDKQRQALGILIKNRREQKGLSQHQLADLLKTVQPRIAELEKGETKSIDTYLSCIDTLDGELNINWIA